MTRIISLKTPFQIREMEAGAQTLRQFFNSLGPLMIAGTSGLVLAQAARRFFAERQYRLILAGYHGFPAPICVNVNHCAAHGVPTASPFADGDIVTVDLAIEKAGFCSDMAWTWIVGSASADSKRLVATAWQACVEAAGQADVAAISRAVNRVADQNDCRVLSQFSGHGLGRQLHEAPKIGYGPVQTKTQQPALAIGTVYTIEPIIVEGRSSAEELAKPLAKQRLGYFLPVGQRRAQFEVMVAIEPNGPRLLGF